MNKICTINNCEKKFLSRGLCSKHYYRWKRYGSPFIVRAERHGMRNTAEYRCWTHLKERCNNPNDERYEDYGKRGITVCGRWLNSFMNFYQDMGDKPSSKHSIDRINNNGNYEPSNCRWATASEQVRNRRPNKNTRSVYRGVRWNGYLNKWQVYFRNKYIGVFVNKEDAIQKRKLVEEKYYGTIA